MDNIGNRGEKKQLIAGAAIKKSGDCSPDFKSRMQIKLTIGYATPIRHEEATNRETRPAKLLSLSHASR
jgi:hypothetical protein